MARKFVLAAWTLLRRFTLFMQDWRYSRSAYQWFVSVREYLTWRAGRAWRPTSQRFLPRSWDYTCAVNEVNQAWADLRECGCVYCQGAPFYAPRVAVRKVAA